MNTLHATCEYGRQLESETREFPSAPWQFHSGLNDPERFFEIFLAALAGMLLKQTIFMP
jgi:hypothetical protein